MQKYAASELSSTFEYSPFGLCIIDPRSQLIDYCNPLFQKLLDKTNADLIGRNYADMLGDKWRLNQTLIDEVIVHKSTLKRTFNSPTYSIPVETKELHATYTSICLGSKDLLLLSIEPVKEIKTFSDDLNILNPNNPIKELAKSNILLNELNASLKESQDNLESAFEAGNLGHCGINFITGEVTLSDKGRSFFGLSETIDVTWESLLEAVDPAYHDMVNNAFSDALNLGKPVDSTYSITHLISLEKRWIRVKARVHTDLVGKPIKLFGLVMDITEEKNDEERKNDFIAMVSHELKTPLTAIQGYIQLIQRKIDNRSDILVSNLIEKTITQMSRMSKLINGFLNVARLESGNIDIQPSEFDFGTLLEELREEARATISSHKVSIKVVSQILIHADRDKIQQVLNNLLSNAVKYSPTGTEISVDCELTKKLLTVRVKDNGIGLNLDDRIRVFERFYRVESKITENVSGFGIGLYICKEIINRHKGEIWAESNRVKGTTFSFTLPC